MTKQVIITEYGLLRKLESHGVPLKGVIDRHARLLRKIAENVINKKEEL